MVFITSFITYSSMCLVMLMVKFRHFGKLGIDLRFCWIEEGLYTHVPSLFLGSTAALFRTTVYYFELIINHVIILTWFV